MLSVRQVLLKKDPTGTFTVTVKALNAKGEIVVGHYGGAEASRVSEVTNLIISELDSKQAHISLVNAPEKKTKA